jgi:hypothetical protein
MAGFQHLQKFLQSLEPADTAEVALLVAAEGPNGPTPLKPVMEI